MSPKSHQHGDCVSASHDSLTTTTSLFFSSLMVDANLLNAVPTFSRDSWRALTTDSNSIIVALASSLRSLDNAASRALALVPSKEIPPSYRMVYRAQSLHRRI
ncbi:unnamed protein product [Macrosiphum euphorbiae]|uniref:Uncharacterized protein n=1 Tax=Macrosiphum euphorbiae TaxID=13131 RepID=A0AAV0WNH6_9HEMI|nr:unnamed protein product [Macrosiphum euphorbiae]